MWTPDIVRSRIRTSMIMRRLTDHVLGNAKMSPSQVTAGLGLLRKTLPDLSQMDVKSSIPNDVRDLDSEEIRRRIAALEGAALPSGSEEQSPEVH
jgi:hypothetical protein